MSAMGPERKIQVAVISYAKKKHGALCKKMESGRFGSTGWPDYMICGGSGFVFFVEFKRPGGKLTPLQAAVREELEQRGFEYYVVDDVKYGKKIMDEELETL